MYRVGLLKSGLQGRGITEWYASKEMAEREFDDWVEIVRRRGTHYAMTVVMFDDGDCPIKSYTPSFGEDHHAMKEAWLRGFDRGIKLNRKFPIKLEIEKIKDLRKTAAEMMHTSESVTGRLEYATLNGYYAGLLSERK